jgi:eukaryotic-like serine/threonine-protein kinase
MRNVGWTVLGALAALVAGALLVNFVIMPRIVQHGVSVPVPAIAGMSIADARRTCAAAGLQLVEEDHQHSATLPPQHVVSQSPAAQTPVKRGRGVRVVVSLGEERVAVPELRGLSLRQAGLELQNAQLILGQVARVRGAGGDGKVQVSSPHAGSEAAMGDSVAVLVASGDGSDAFLMPNLAGQELGDVRALIESRGFRVGDVAYRDVKDVFPGTVLEQSPARGARIRRGESIDLVVANPD